MGANTVINICDGLNGAQADHLFCAAKGAQEALCGLEALFKAIMREASGHPDILNLARLGNYHAVDQANITYRMIESLELGEVE